MPPPDLRAPGCDEIESEDSGRVAGGLQRAPLRTIGSAEMDTPHIRQSHAETIDPSIVPASGRVFRSVDEAHKFYLRYAYEVGFPLKKGAARRRENNSNDMAKLLEFFTECRKQNPQFFCDFQLEDDGKIKSIFWSHASQQGEYADFRDAVTVDTTHKTNLYGKPLGMFVGANNHLQCTTFGFVLLGDETIETFEWAFNAFKMCVGVTGRGESMNKVVKNSHVDANTPLHEFAKQMMKMMYERKMKEAAEALACKGQRETNTLYPFEIRVARAYTRAVMCRFEESMKYSTAYKIVPDPDGGPDDYLVRHTNRSNKIVWGQHEFKVKTDVDAGKYHYECKQWEHTVFWINAWLLCVHLIKAFTHLQIERIPKEYVMKRYTTNAKVDVLFHRDDRKMQGKDGETALGRQNVVMLKTMKVVTLSGMSEARKNMALVVLDKLIEDMERVAPDINGEENCINNDGIDCQDDGASAEKGRGQGLAVQRNDNLSVCGEVAADAEQQTADAGETVVNGSSSQGIQPHDAIEARKRLHPIFEAISLEKLDRAKPKGRTIKENEASSLKLGAKGEKKKNRK
ncbi:hypothetical protein U9M48_042264 [Paspalum notatum var. saurae]|uniref:Protein FAR1-RELATED SEQUENCE n=1 Tax=Paspalum notatum var. saurae TaxID=547442 RepID=A0AAQ3UWM7_PASNO